MTVVRRARLVEAEYLALCVNRLVAELAGREPAAPTDAAVGYAKQLADEGSGVICLVAEESGGQPLGMITASVQPALRVGAPYALIQELWIDPAARATGAGRALLDGLAKMAALEGIDLVEVGLPATTAPVFESTLAFYERCGYQSVGPRMRRRLDATPRP